MVMHLRPEYQTDLASKGGWLTIFIIFAFLALLAFMRGAAASVVSGGVGGVSGLALTFVTLVALTGLLMRKRWSYYLFVLFGIFMLIQLGLAMLASPDKLFYTDWKFDVPVVFEWLLVLVWTAYFLCSRRVYSVLFGDTPAPLA
jgi:hypothetical protein